MQSEVVSAAKAAELMQLDIRSVQRYVDAGKVKADATISAYGGGNGGIAYRVYVDSLPAMAQIRYWQESAQAELGHAGQELKLVDYQEQYGEEGMTELLQRQRAVLAAHGLRLSYRASCA